MQERSISFDASMRERQIAWRKNPGNVECRDWGWQNGRQYEHILPSAQWEQSLWPGIRTDTVNSLPAYIAGNSIQAHQGKHNLKSSWVLCANLYFPFGSTPEGRTLLAGFLHDYVSCEVKNLDALHLEYAETGDLNPSSLLGETGGMRGSGQTSPDLAFTVNDGKGLILCENKLVEHSFYPCSARRREDNSRRPGNPDPSRCLNVGSVLDSPATQCHQCQWNRKYWDILLPVVKKDAVRALPCCPAAHAGYQLFRQQALAEGVANSGKYDLVYSCVALDSRNTTLLDCLKSTGISNLETDWAALFNGKAGFKVFTHQQWVAWVRDHGDRSVWESWLKYIHDRYGY